MIGFIVLFNGSSENLTRQKIPCCPVFVYDSFIFLANFRTQRNNRLSVCYFVCNSNIVWYYHKKKFQTAETKITSEDIPPNKVSKNKIEYITETLCTFHPIEYNKILHLCSTEFTVRIIFEQYLYSCVLNYTLDISIQFIDE